MCKKFFPLLLAFASMALGQKAFAQSAIGNATATLIIPITLANSQDLQFGRLMRGATPGTVIITPAGARSATGGVSLVVAGSTQTQAIFTATGEPNATYAITLPVSTTLAFGANTMTVNTFTSTPSGTGTLAVGGTQVINVGATLNVTAAQASGAYAGTFTVTVAYN